MEEDGILLYMNKVYVPNSQKLKKLVLKNMHNVPYVGHLGYQKTIVVVRAQYYWLGNEETCSGFIAKCLECQKVKVEHKHPMGLLQPFPIKEWK
jgi:hypothetical protein